MKAYPMGNEKKFDVSACRKNYDKNAKTRKERKDKAKDKIINKETKDGNTTSVSGMNGEVVTVPVVNQMGGVKDYKYHPELDGPPKWSEEEEKKLRVELDKPSIPAPEYGKPVVQRDPVPPTEMESELDKMSNDIEKERAKLSLPKEQVKPEVSLPSHGVSCDELLTARPISSLYCKDQKADVCYIIGGGFSTEPYLDLLRTKAEHTFGCSGVPLLFPELRHWYPCDVVRTEPMVEWFWNRSKRTVKVLSYEAYRSSGEVPSDCIVCSTPKLGPSSKPDQNGLWHGCSSTIGACEMARLMGYRAIYLFGVDYDKRSHPFDSIDPEQGKNTKEWNQERVAECWQRVVNTYASFKIKILNCNENSLIVKLNIMKSVDPYKAFQGG